jgi:hypothetical protein
MNSDELDGFAELAVGVNESDHGEQPTKHRPCPVVMASMKAYLWSTPVLAKFKRAGESVDVDANKA